MSVGPVPGPVLRDPGKKRTQVFRFSNTLTLFLWKFITEILHCFENIYFGIIHI